MANILFLSQLLPYPPDAGAKVRSYYVLRWLAQEHDVTLLAFHRPDDQDEAVQHLEKICKRVVIVPMRRSWLNNLKSLTTSVYRNDSFIIRRDTAKEMEDSLKEELKQRKYDFIHADQLWMAQYALLAKQLQPDLKLVLDEHNACFQIFERLASGERNPLKHWLWKREAVLLRQYEESVCFRFNQVVTVTEENRRLLEEGSGGGNWLTIPICVDTADFQVVDIDPLSRNVLHLGTMFWPPNVEGIVWFGREVWPLVIEKIKDASLTIAGKSPPEALRRLEGNFENIHVTGYVPNPQPYLEQAAVFIVPLISGGGMRVKILDAWRWGLPVISTRVGAEGISYRDGENILIVDTAEDFAEAIVRVMTDVNLARRLRNNGRAWVCEQYEWTKVYNAWDKVYQVR